MADEVGNKIGKDYHLGTPPKTEGFYLKGLSHCEWGMKNRLARIFNPFSGNTTMLAFDHGYIMGSTSGLERLDVVIDPLIPYVDILMATRGAFRTCISPIENKAICLRASHDATVVNDDLSIGNGFGLDFEEAIRMNASALAYQTFVGAPGEKESLGNLCQMVDQGAKYGIPIMGVVAVGKQMARDLKFFLIATRVLAEMGVQFVKTYYCEEFEKVAAACPVPIVIAGGKKLPENEALTMAYRAISEGAHGVDMGRNIFQSECPVGMAAAISQVVHEGFSDQQAYETYLAFKNKKN